MRDRQRNQADQDQGDDPRHAIEAGEPEIEDRMRRLDADEQADKLEAEDAPEQKPGREQDWELNEQKPT